MHKHALGPWYFRQDGRFQIVRFPMGIFQFHFPGQNQVEIDMDPGARIPGPQFMDIDPTRPAVGLDDCGNLIEHRGIGRIHEPLVGSPYQTRAGQ